MKIKKRLITKKDFFQILVALLNQSSCPISNIQYHVVSSEPFKDITIRAINQSFDHDFFINDDFKLNDNRNSKCYIKIWKKNERDSNSHEIIRLMRGLFYSYWKPGFRSAPAGAIDLKRNLKIGKMIKHTFKASLDERSVISLLYCDLDNFKSINTEYGIKEGDKVLKQVGAILEDLTIDTRILLHNGGDEFVILMPDGNEADAKMFARYIKNAVGSFKFFPNGFCLDISIGISSVYSQNASFDAILESAYKAMLSEKSGPGGI